MDLVERALRLLRDQAEVSPRNDVLVIVLREGARPYFSLDIVLSHAAEVQELLRAEARWLAGLEQEL